MQAEVTVTQGQRGKLRKGLAGVRVGGQMCVRFCVRNFCSVLVLVPSVDSLLLWQLPFCYAVKETTPKNVWPRINSVINLSIKHTRSAAFFCGASREILKWLITELMTKLVQNLICLIYWLRFDRSIVILFSLLLLWQFHWKYNTPQFHQTTKLKFLGTNWNQTKVSNSICTARYRGIRISRFGG